MSSSRTMYDEDETKTRLGESTKPVDYMLDPTKYVNERKCRIEQVGIIGGNNVSLFSGNLVDLESSLRGQDRQLGKTVEKNYQPKCSSKGNQKSGIPNDGCQDGLRHLNNCTMIDYKQKVSNPKLRTQHCKYNIMENGLKRNFN